MAKERYEYKRYDLPLDYFQDHEVYKVFYNPLIQELSTLHHEDCEDVEIEDLYNDAKLYIDRVLTAKHPELELSRADKEILNANFLHEPSNSYYAYIVRLLFYTVVYISVKHTDSMRQALVWVYTNIEHDGYTYSGRNHKGSLTYKLIYECNPRNPEYNPGFNTKAISINSAFYELDREYKNEVKEYNHVYTTEAPTLTKIVEDNTESTPKDNRQKLPLHQDVVIEIIKQLAIKAGYKPDETNNIDFAKFCCLMTPYSPIRVNARYKFNEGKSFIENIDKYDIKDLMFLIEKLGIDIKLS